MQELKTLSRWTQKQILKTKQRYLLLLLLTIVKRWWMRNSSSSSAAAKKIEVWLPSRFSSSLSNARGRGERPHTHTEVASPTRDLEIWHLLRVRTRRNEREYEINARDHEQKYIYIQKKKQREDQETARDRDANKDPKDQNAKETKRKPQLSSTIHQEHSTRNRSENQEARIDKKGTSRRSKAPSFPPTANQKEKPSKRRKEKRNIFIQREKNY